MALKAQYAKAADIPEPLKSFYVERDGAFYLDAEGHPERAKVDEMRASNVALKKQLDELSGRFAGIDPEEVRKLAAEKAKLEEAALLKAGEFEKVLTTRLGAVKSDFEKQAAALQAERDAATARLTAVLVDKGVLEAATKRGLRTTAIPDITARARGALKLVDGAPVVLEADGQTVRRGGDGVAPMTLEEWVEAQAKDAPHLFESNAGGGAAGGGSGGAAFAGGKNPFRRDSWNLTEQARLEHKNPVLAAHLKAAAGG